MRPKSLEATLYLKYSLLEFPNLLSGNSPNTIEMDTGTKSSVLSTLSFWNSSKGYLKMKRKSKTPEYTK